MCRCPGAFAHTYRQRNVHPEQSISAESARLGGLAPSGSIRRPATWRFRLSLAFLWQAWGLKQKYNVLQGLDLPVFVMVGVQVP